jgi:macrolide transport system ATP-binding/permease protein
MTSGMRRLRAWIVRLAALWPNARRAEARDRELAEELDAHLQMHIDDNIRAGMNPELARRTAMLKLGGVEATKELYRERRSVPVIEHVAQDLRFAIRQLLKNPGFTSTAILMLTLGICASVSIFAFVDAAMLKPLPYAEPSRIVGVYEKVEMFPRSNISYLDYLDWNKLQTTFSSLDLYQGSAFALGTDAGPQSVRGARVSDGFFHTLGVVPVLGRDFHAGEDLLSAPRTVLLTYAAWQARYGGSSDVLGQTVTLNDEPNVIIGVLPRDFHFTPVGSAEFFATIHASTPCDLRRSCHSFYGIARLKESTTFEAALADVQSIAKRLEQQYPDSNRGQGGTIAQLTDIIYGRIRPIVLVLLAGAVLLLLIASINVASLLLVRSENRRREMAVRSALGASTARLVSQFVTEGLVLVGAGALLGIASATVMMQLLLKLIPADKLATMSYLQGVGLNGRVLTFAIIVSLLAAALFAITPALRMPWSEMREGLNEGSRGSAGNVWRRLGSKLVVLELATAMVLLVGAGLLGRSLYLLLRVDLGLQPDHLATMEVVAPKATYEKPEQQLALAKLLLNRLSVLPGVASVGLVSQLPLSFNGNTMWIRVIGRPWNGEHNDTPQRDVSADYFKTIGARLLRGRYFTEADDLTKPKVTIVNEAMAKKWFPDGNAVGQHITYLGDKPDPIEIVGIVADIREGPLDDAIPPVMYVPTNQDPDRYYGVVIRTSLPEEPMLATAAATVRDIDRDLVTNIGGAMQRRITESGSAYLHRSMAWLMGGFAVLALLLGVVGLYGVITYSVSQRSREIGIRMALGAERQMVYRLILGEAGVLTSAGVVIGLLCSLGATTLMRDLLFGVKTWDLPTMVVVALLLACSALLAAYIPARRAASVNPVEALRAE